MGPFPERPGFRYRYRTTLRPDFPRRPPGLGNRPARSVRHGEERILQYPEVQGRNGCTPGDWVSVLTLAIALPSGHKKGASERSFGHAFLLLQHGNIFDLEN